MSAESTVTIILGVLETLATLVANALSDLPDSSELKAEALARLAEVQTKLASHDDFAAGLQAELDAAVPTDGG